MLFACDHDSEIFEEFFIEIARVGWGVFIDPFILACGIHGPQSFEDGLASFFADVIFGHKEVGLEIIWSDDGIIIDRDVDTSKDEVFGQFGIDSIGRGDEDSEGEQPK